MTTLPTIDRRRLLISAGATIVAGALYSPAAAATQGAAPAVLVHAANLADFAQCGLLAGANPFWTEAAEEIVAEQAETVRSLERSGFAILHLDEVLDSAVAEAGRRNILAGWLRRHAPRLAEGAAPSVSTLVGRVDASRLLDFTFRLAPELRTYRPRHPVQPSKLHLSGGLVLPLEPV